jgi:hypothetical protein
MDLLTTFRLTTLAETFESASNWKMLGKWMAGKD